MTTCDDDCPLRNYRTQYTVDSLRDSDKITHPCYRPLTVPRLVIWTQRLRSTQIRVLRIEPGDPEAEILTSLLVATMTFQDGVELDDTKEVITYNALSYSWGYSHETVPVQCNGQTIPALRTLYEALYHLRLREKAVHIWIDALCINQTDAAEKSVQVSKMSSIFYKAERVIAYLGHSYICSSAALQLLREVNLIGHDLSCCEGLKHLLLSIQLLLKAPYFRRTWVRQEVFMANKLHVQTSFSRMKLEKFVGKITKLLRLGESRLPTMTDADKGQLLKPIPASLALLRRGTAEDKAKVVFESVHFSGSQARGLEAVLRGSCNFQATDPRDFVYGVASMTTSRLVHTTPSTDHPASEENEAIRIDYSRPVNTVYEDTTISLMRKARSLDPMFFAYETRSQGGLQEGLASWCPNWSLLPEKSLLDTIWAVAEERKMLFGSLPRSHLAAQETYQNRSALALDIVPVHMRPPLDSGLGFWVAAGAQLTSMGCILGWLKNRSYVAEYSPSWFSRVWGKSTSLSI